MFQALTKILVYSIRRMQVARMKAMTVDITDIKKVLIPKSKITHRLRDEILQTYVIHFVETFERSGFNRKAF